MGWKKAVKESTGFGWWWYSVSQLSDGFSGAEICQNSKKMYVFYLNNAGLKKKYH